MDKTAEERKMIDDAHSIPPDEEKDTPRCVMCGDALMLYNDELIIDKMCPYCGAKKVKEILGDKTKIVRQKRGGIMEDNALVTMDKNQLMNPNELNEYATKVAMTLTRIIEKKPKKVIINNEQYLEYEDWQTVGAPFGISVKTGSAEPIEIEGIKGAKAKAEVYKDGKIIGGADAYCLRDERNWETKPWFQLASMAQTRAGAKALRNVLSWVVMLAGYRTTPAEEMVEGTITPKEVSTSDKEKQDELYALIVQLNNNDKTESEIKRLLKEFTSFKGDKGLVSCDSFKKLKGKWLHSTIDKVKKAINENTPPDEF